MKEGGPGGFDTIGATHRFFRGRLSEKEQELQVVKKNKPGFISYGPVFFVALFKDLLDLVMIGSLPVIGTAITFCCSFTIFILLLLTRANKKLIDSRFLLRMGIALLLGSMAEGFIFGLNFLPIETITIAVIYFMDKTLSEEQIEKVTKLLSALHGEYGNALKTAKKKSIFQRRAQERASEEESSQPAEEQPKETRPVLRDIAGKRSISPNRFPSKNESGIAEPLVLPGVVVPKNTDITKKALTFREKIEGGARKIALPAATAFALGGAPVAAHNVENTPSPQEKALSVTGKSSEEKTSVNAHAVDAPSLGQASPLSSAKSSVTTKYSTLAELVDNNSPLNISSPKLEGVRSIGTEDLPFLNEMHTKVWEAPNEWMALSGTDTDGKYVAEVHDMGELGGRKTFQIEANLQNSVLTHTHPVSLATSTLGVSAEKIRNGEARAFVMPPSAADIGQCMDDSGMSRLQRIVDPRGMWEYKCDDKHPFVKSRERLTDGIVTVINTLKTSYRISDSEFKDALTAVSGRHPNFLFSGILEQLESKYPGVQMRGQELLEETMASQGRVGRLFTEYENKNTKLVQDSMQLSDAQLAVRIKLFVEEAEKMGIYIRYIPFKK